MDKGEQFFSTLFFQSSASSEMESLYRNLVQGLYFQKKTNLPDAKAGQSEDCRCWQDLEINSVIFFF